MSVPTRQMVHVNRPLTNVSIAYSQSEDNFVASKVFPIIPVEKQTDSYFIYDRADFLRNNMAKRARGAESNVSGFRVSNDTYRCDEWTLAFDLDDQDRANYDSPLDEDMDATEYLTQQGLISREVEWANTFFGTGIWGTEVSGIASSPGANQVLHWNETASTPFTNVTAAMSAVQLKSGGHRPNTMVMGQSVYDVLRNHPEMIDRVRNTIINGGGNASKMITVDASDMAAAFGINRVLVMGAVQNTAAEGAAESLAWIGGKHVLLCHSASTPGLRRPSAGYTFTWRGLAGNDAGLMVKKYRIESRSSDRIEHKAAYALKKTGAELGYFFNGVIA